LNATGAAQGVAWPECKEGDWQVDKRLGYLQAKEGQKVCARKEC